MGSSGWPKWPPGTCSCPPRKPAHLLTCVPTFGFAHACACQTHVVCPPHLILRMHATSVHVCTYVCPVFPLARLRSYAAPSVHVRKLCHPPCTHPMPQQGSSASTRAGSKTVSRSERCHQCLQRRSRSMHMHALHPQVEARPGGRKCAVCRQAGLKKQLTDVQVGMPGLPRQCP